MKNSASLTHESIQEASSELASLLFCKWNRRNEHWESFYLPHMNQHERNCFAEYWICKIFIMLFSAWQTHFHAGQRWYFIFTSFSFATSILFLLEELHISALFISFEESFAGSFQESRLSEIVYEPLVEVHPAKFIRIMFIQNRFDISFRWLCTLESFSWLILSSVIQL